VVFGYKKIWHCATLRFRARLWANGSIRDWNE